MTRLNKSAEMFLTREGLLDLVIDPNRISVTANGHVYCEKDLLDTGIDPNTPGLTSYVHATTRYFPENQFNPDGTLNQDVLQMNRHLAKIFTFVGIPEDRISAIINAWWDFPSPRMDAKLPRRVFATNPGQVHNVVLGYFLVAFVPTANRVIVEYILDHPSLREARGS